MKLFVDFTVEKIYLYRDRFFKKSCNFYTYAAGGMMVFGLTLW